MMDYEITSYDYCSVIMDEYRTVSVLRLYWSYVLYRAGVPKAGARFGPLEVVMFSDVLCRC